MLVVGELINCTRKAIKEAVERADRDYIAGIARKQAEAGVNYIDVNAGIPRKGPETMKWLVDLVQSVVDLPLCIDSESPKNQIVGLECYDWSRGKPLMNSISLEDVRLAGMKPLIEQFKPRVIGMCIKQGGLAEGVEERVKVAGDLVDLLTKAGIPIGDIFIDPCVLPVGVNKNFGRDAMGTVERLMVEFPGIHTICGLSNVSFGLPVRKQLNQIFLPMMIGAGLDAVICDPLDRRLMANLVAAETLGGRDESCRAYIAAHRNGRLKLDGE